MVQEEAAQQVKQIGIRSRAVQRNPDLFTRSRGKLRWETDIPLSAQRELTHIGDEERLQAYIAASYDDLDRELADIKPRAKLVPPARSYRTQMRNSWNGWAITQQSSRN